jgi:WD40 repeat protein
MKMKHTIVVGYRKGLHGDFVDLIQKDLESDGNIVIRCDNQCSPTCIEQSITNRITHDSRVIMITSPNRTIPLVIKAAIEKNAYVIPVVFANQNIPLYASGSVAVLAPPMSEISENEHAYSQFYTNLLYQLRLPGNQHYRGNLPTIEILRRQLSPLELSSKLHSIGFPLVSRKWSDDSESAQTLIIAGSYGSGKTVLTTELLFSELNVKACYWCNNLYSAEHELIEIIKNISYQFALQFKEYSNYLIDAVPKRVLSEADNVQQVFQELVLFPLEHVVSLDSRRIVLLIDGIDQSYQKGDQLVSEFIDYCVRALPLNVKIILTMRSDSPLLGILSSEELATYYIHKGKQLSDIELFITTHKKFWRNYIGLENADLLGQALQRYNNGSFRYVATISEAVYNGFFTFLPKQEYLLCEQFVVEASVRPRNKAADFDCIMHTLDQSSIWHLLSVLSLQQDEADSFLYGFIEENKNLLKSSDAQWPARKIFIQLALELTEKHPVRVEVEKWLQQHRPSWILLRCEQKHNGFLNKDYSILSGHRGRVLGALYTDNGFVVSWSEDDPFLRVWDSRGNALGVCTGHSSEIEEGIPIRNQHILSWSADGTICIWDEDLNLTTRFIAEHSRYMTGAEQLDNTMFITWGTDGVVQFWSETGVYLSRIQAHEKSVLQVIKMGSGLLVSIGSDLSICIFTSEGHIVQQMRSNAESQTQIPLKINPFRTLDRVSYSKELTGLAKLSGDRFIAWGGTAVVEQFDAPRIWTIDGELIAILNGHTRPINNVLELSNSTILTSSLDGTLRLWTKSGVLLQVLSAQEDQISGVIETRDGTIVAWGREHSIRCWSLTGEYKGIAARHTSYVQDLWEISKDEFLSVDTNGEYKLWSIEASFPQKTLNASKLRSMCALTLTQRNILSWGYDKSLYLWNLDSEKEFDIQGHKDFIGGAMFDRNTDRIISWGASPQLCFWDADGNLVSKSNETDDFLFESCDLLQLHDGRMVTYGSIPNIALWSAEGEVITFLKGHEDEILEVQELASGKLISRSSDFTLILWSSEGKLDKRMDEHISPPIGMYEFEDGTILSWDRDKLFCIWSNTGKLLSKLSNVEAIVRYPSIQKVIDAVPEENYGFDYAHKTLILRNKANGNEARWISNENVTAHQALADGRVLVSFDTGDIGILQLYKGNRPVSLKEFLSI